MNVVNSTELMDACEHLGVQLAADGRRLRYRPADALTGELRMRLQEQKHEVMAMLDAQAARANHAVQTRDPLEGLDEDQHARDGELWRGLLGLAYPIDGKDPTGLLGTLRGIRACGGSLVPSDDGQQLELWPPDGVTRDELVEWIGPRAGLLRDLLGRGVTEEVARHEAA